LKSLRLTCSRLNTALRPLLLSTITLELSDPVPLNYLHGGPTLLLALAKADEICEYIRKVTIRYNFPESPGQEAVSPFDLLPMKRYVPLCKILRNAILALRHVNSVQ
jgi:hypothetical protein